MIRQLLSTAVMLVSTVSFVSGQVVVLNSPAPWMTMRNDSIVAKAQVDTTVIKSRVVDYTLSSVIGGVTKVVAKKQVKISDVSSDAFVAKVNSSILGGTDYLKLEWAADSQKGEISPIGILALDKMPKVAPLQAKKVDSAAALKAVADIVKDDQFVKFGARTFALAWNQDALYIVVKKTADTAGLVFGIDGKNGKNAFAAYPDRFVCLKQDAVWGKHYDRAIEKTSLKYNEIAWNNEITKEIVGEKIVIRMPWYDTGIVPFDGRQAGFAAFIKDKAAASYPEKAKQPIPGTWGTFVLVK